MARFWILVLLTATALGAQISRAAVSSDTIPVATFNKDVLPILQNNCQTCHRPGGIAPMPFMTYESTRPWAKAMKSAVLKKEMPPWFADPQYGKFRNAPKLTQSDVNTLVAWADTGAREGDAADKPAARQWVDGWRIQPDVVVSMPVPYRVAAKGAGEIKEFIVPNPFKEDTWVSSIEIRPGDPSVVHHVLLQVPEKNSGFRLKVAGGEVASNCDNCLQAAVLHKDAVALRAEQAVLREQQVQTARAVLRTAVVDAESFIDGIKPNGSGSYSDAMVRLRERMTGQGAFTTMEAIYAPGSPPLDFRFSGSAKLIPGGKPLRIEVHYTPNGKETTDQTTVGFTLAKAPAQRRFVIMAPEHLVDDRRPIPAGEANWETSGELTFNQDAELVWFMPHMHLRGKDMTFRLIYPNGREETLLSARFNFHWQLGYEVERPIKVPKGARMVVTAHHDNSATNRLNPAPGQPAHWGEMTSEEMMLPWFGVVVEGDARPEMIASYRPGHLDSSSAPALQGAAPMLDLLQQKIRRVAR